MIPVNDESLGGRHKSLQGSRGLEQHLEGVQRRPYFFSIWPTTGTACSEKKTSRDLPLRCCPQPYSPKLPNPFSTPKPCTPTDRKQDPPRSLRLRLLKPRPPCPPSKGKRPARLRAGTRAPTFSMPVPGFRVRLGSSVRSRSSRLEPKPLGVSGLGALKPLGLLFSSEFRS